MTKDELFFKMKYKLVAKYPQFDFEIKESALIIKNKNPKTWEESFNVPILRYIKENDKMVLSFPKIVEIGKNSSSQVKKYVTHSIDTFRLDYYNVCENHIDYIVDNLFSHQIQLQVEKYEKMQKDFE